MKLTKQLLFLSCILASSLKLQAMHKHAIDCEAAHEHVQRMVTQAAETGKFRYTRVQEASKTEEAMSMSLDAKQAADSKESKELAHQQTEPFDKLFKGLPSDVHLQIKNLLLDPWEFHETFLIYLPLDAEKFNSVQKYAFYSNKEYELDSTHMAGSFIDLGDILITSRYTTLNTSPEEDLFYQEIPPAQQNIKVYDKATKQCTFLIGHDTGVTHLTPLTETILASGSADGSIKIWDIQNGTCCATLSGHTDKIYALFKISPSILASASRDHTIKIWNTTTHECTITLVGHTDAVTDLVKLSDTLLISSSWDHTIKVWDIVSGACIGTLDGHTAEITALIKLSPTILVSSSRDNTIKIWHLKHMRCITTLTAFHESPPMLKRLDDDSFISRTRENEPFIHGFSLAKQAFVNLSFNQFIRLDALIKQLYRKHFELMKSAETEGATSPAITLEKYGLKWFKQMPWLIQWGLLTNFNINNNELVQEWIQNKPESFENGDLL